jgi:hypothetical protein
VGLLIFWSWDRGLIGIMTGGWGFDSNVDWKKNALNAEFNG